MRKLEFLPPLWTPVTQAWYYIKSFQEEWSFWKTPSSSFLWTDENRGFPMRLCNTSNPVYHGLRNRWKQDDDEIQNVRGEHARSDSLSTFPAVLSTLYSSVSSLQALLICLNKSQPYFWSTWISWIFSPISTQCKILNKIIQGLPVTLRMVRVKHDKLTNLIGEYQRNSLCMLRKLETRSETARDRIR